jgi:hypothetical protein
LGGTAAAFVGAKINPSTIGWVENFIPTSGENYVPHVTAGVAKEDFAKRMKAEPYEVFTFGADGVAIYQLGNFGTAAKMLWQSQASEPAFVEWPCTEEGRRGLRREGDEGRLARFRPARRTRPSTTTARSGPSSRSTSSSPSLDRVKALAPQHPEWKEKEPFASLLKGDIKSALAGGEPAIFQIVMTTHAG